MFPNAFISISFLSARSFCHPNPCRNGFCYEKHKGYECSCETGFKGSNCESKFIFGFISIHVRILNTFWCWFYLNSKFSSTDYTGTGLRTLISNNYSLYNNTAPSFCHPNPCLNGGICSEDDTGYKCSCSKGFYGTNCDCKFILTYKTNKGLYKSVKSFSTVYFGFRISDIKSIVKME